MDRATAEAIQADRDRAAEEAIGPHLPPEVVSAKKEAAETKAREAALKEEE